MILYKQLIPDPTTKKCLRIVTIWRRSILYNERGPVNPHSEKSFTAKMGCRRQLAAMTIDCRSTTTSTHSQEYCIYLFKNNISKIEKTNQMSRDKRQRGKKNSHLKLPSCHLHVYFSCVLDILQRSPHTINVDPHYFLTHSQPCRFIWNSQSALSDITEIEKELSEKYTVALGPAPVV